LKTFVASNSKDNSTFSAKNGPIAIKGSSGNNIFILENGIRHQIFPRDFQNLPINMSLQIWPDSEVIKFPKGPAYNVTKDIVVVKSQSDPNIYALVNGTRRSVTKKELKYLGIKDKLQVLSDEYVNKLPIAKSYNSTENLVVVKKKNSDSLFILKDGMVYPVASSTLEALGYSLNRVTSISGKRLKKYPVGHQFLVSQGDKGR
jgi:hypothetical protein